jgi:hypothetical protein
VCQDLCKRTPTSYLPPPVDEGQNQIKRERYCDQQCQVNEALGAACYQIKPDQRASVLQALRQDWEMREESKFLPND